MFCRPALLGEPKDRARTAVPRRFFSSPGRPATKWRLAISGLLALLCRQGAAPGAPVQWHLSTRPAVAIGEAGNASTRFIRAGAALRLPGGEIAVANAGTAEIRIFDRDGRFLRAFGTSGAGPGQFRNPSLVGHSGDTLFIADRANARITEFLASGTLLKTIPIAGGDVAAGATVIGRLKDGRWAVVTPGAPNLSGPQRIYRDTSHVGILAADASGGVLWIGSVPGMTIFVHNPANAPQGDIAAAVPGAPAAVSAVAGDEILVGDTGANVIGAYSSAGAVLRLIAVPLEAAPLTEENIEMLRRKAVAHNPTERARPFLTALYSRDVLGARLPVFRSIVPDLDGTLWVQPYQADPAQPVRWLVLDPAGKPLAWVRVPGGLRITDTGPGYVLGVYTEADGLETIRLYQLTPQ